MSDLGRGIYMIGEVGRSERRIKIGMTMVGDDRIIGLGKQNAAPLELLWWWPQKGRTRKTIIHRERWLHRHFGALRVYGEWFEDDNPLSTFVDSPYTLADRCCEQCGCPVDPFWVAPGDTHVCSSSRLTECQGGGCKKSNLNHALYAHEGDFRWVRCIQCWKKVNLPFADYVIQQIESGNLAPLARVCSRAALDAEIWGNMNGVPA